jgi:uncharacterized cysteine cluster protein YcgN (CxxCxxCC family)
VRPRGFPLPPRSGRQRWEAVCTQCGLCCYQKEWRFGKIVTNYRAPCRFLDESSRLCTIYERRFRECAECRRMTIFHALFVSYLPAECGYVRRFRFWRRRDRVPV